MSLDTPIGPPSILAAQTPTPKTPDAIVALTATAPFAINAALVAAPKALPPAAHSFAAMRPPPSPATSIHPTETDATPWLDDATGAPKERTRSLTFLFALPEPSPRGKQTPKPPGHRATASAAALADIKRKEAAGGASAAAKLHARTAPPTASNSPRKTEDDILAFLTQELDPKVPTTKIKIYSKELVQDFATILMSEPPPQKILALLDQLTTDPQKISLLATILHALLDPFTRQPVHAKLIYGFSEKGALELTKQMLRDEILLASGKEVLRNTTNARKMSTLIQERLLGPLLAEFEALLSIIPADPYILSNSIAAKFSTKKANDFKLNPTQHTAIIAEQQTAFLNKLMEFLPKLVELSKKFPPLIIELNRAFEAILLIKFKSDPNAQALAKIRTPQLFFLGYLSPRMVMPDPPKEGAKKPDAKESERKHLHQQTRVQFGKVLQTLVGEIQADKDPAYLFAKNAFNVADNPFRNFLEQFRLNLLGTSS